MRLSVTLDDYTKPFGVFCSPHDYAQLTLHIHNMFFQATNLQSSNVRTLRLNPATNQAMVQFINNAKTYLYENVNSEAIVDFFFGDIESAGKFVNAYCKGNQYTVVG